MLELHSPSQYHSFNRKSVSMLPPERNKEAFFSTFWSKVSPLCTRVNGSRQSSEAVELHMQSIFTFSATEGKLVLQDKRKQPRSLEIHKINPGRPLRGWLGGGRTVLLYINMLTWVLGKLQTGLSVLELPLGRKSVRSWSDLSGRMLISGLNGVRVSSPVSRWMWPGLWVSWRPAVQRCQFAACLPQL